MYLKFQCSTISIFRIKHNNYENIKLTEGQTRQLQRFAMPSLFFIKVSIIIVEGVTEYSKHPEYKGKLLTSFLQLNCYTFVSTSCTEAE